MTEINEPQQFVCRECRESVQPGARKCPHCHCVAPLVSDEDMQAINEERFRRNLVGCLWAGIVLVILAIFVWGLVKR
ncbi:MAG: hypothetical protein ACKPHU_08705 [Planctomycetaceae bacterium]